MNKLLLLLEILTISCNKSKNDKRCWECHTVIYQLTDTAYNKTLTVCDMTADEIKAHEAKNNMQQTSTQGIKQYWVMKCK